MDTVPSAAGLLAALCGPPVVALYGTRWAARPGSLATGLACQAALLGLLALVLTIALVWVADPPSALGLAPPGLSTLAWAAAMTAVFVFALGPLLLRVPGWLGRPGFEGPLRQLQTLPVWYLVLAVLVGGSVEEVLYRGFALDHLARLTGSDALAATLVVVAFGAAHLPLWGWAPALTTAVSGAVLTLFYLWHRDLAANVAAHMATDFVGIVLPALTAKSQRVGPHP